MINILIFANHQVIKKFIAKSVITDSSLKAAGNAITFAV